MRLKICGDVWRDVTAERSQWKDQNGKVNKGVEPFQDVIPNLVFVLERGGVPDLLGALEMLLLDGKQLSAVGQCGAVLHASCFTMIVSEWI